MPGLTYKDAGVDLDKAEKLVDWIKPFAESTFTKGVLKNIGGFNALFSGKNIKEMDDPILVSSTDGVGTKLKIAFAMNKHDTVGIDLVAMCVNDLMVGGAIPLFFLDYLATGKIRQKALKQIISGIAEGCRQAKCALIGGETAEMPGFYPEGEYDMSGFVVGAADKKNLIEGPVEINAGDVLIGLPSSGLHSNGYSLVRKICFDILGLEVDSYVEELGCLLGEELLKPTKIYYPVVSTAQNRKINGMANITGGGWFDNIKRILPDGCSAQLEAGKVPKLSIFSFLQQAGKVEIHEMQRTFNMGVGLVLAVNPLIADNVVYFLSGKGEQPFIFGEIVKAKGKPVIVV